MRIFKKSGMTVTQLCKIRQIQLKKQIEFYLIPLTDQNKVILISFFNKKTLLNCKKSCKIDQELIQQSCYKVKSDLSLVKKVNLLNLNNKKQRSKFFFQTTTVSESFFKKFKAKKKHYVKNCSKFKLIFKLFRSKILFKKISFFVGVNYWKKQFLMNFLTNFNKQLKKILIVINLNYKIHKINHINNIFVKKIIYYVFFLFCKFFYKSQKQKLFLFYKQRKGFNKYKLLTNANFLQKKVQISLFTGKRFINKQIACNLILKKFKWKTLVGRPILNLNRFDIKKLCQFWNLPLYPDKTNNKLKFRRNRIRKQLLPLLRFFFNRQIDQTLYQFSELTLTEKYYLDYLIIRLINNYSNNAKKLKNSLNFSFSFAKSHFSNKQFKNSFFYFIPFGLRKRIFRKMLIS